MDIYLLVIHNAFDSIFHKCSFPCSKAAINQHKHCQYTFAAAVKLWKQSENSARGESIYLGTNTVLKRSLSMALVCNTILRSG